MATALSGELSRRRLGTQSGDMRRESRRLRRDGFNAAAGSMALGASEERLKEGSAITSSEATLAERDESMARDRGLMQLKRDSLLKPEAGGTTPTAANGQSAPKVAGGVAPTRTNAVTPLAAPGTAGSTLQGPPRPAAPATPPREGRINGMPASQALAGVEEPAAFGANYATQNIEKLGLSGAIADYRRREAEAAKPAEPGNMAELKARDFVGPKPSPLQQALNESRTRREGYAADSAAAGKITAGINAAPTPTLGTSFPASAPPAAPAPAPTTLSRPTPSGRALGVKLVEPSVGIAELKNQGYTYDQAQAIIRGRTKEPDPAVDKKKVADYRKTRLGSSSLPKIPLPDYLEDTAYGGVVKRLNR